MSFGVMGGQYRRRATPMSSPRWSIARQGAAGGIRRAAQLRLRRRVTLENTFEPASPRRSRRAAHHSRLSGDPIGGCQAIALDDETGALLGSHATTARTASRSASGRVYVSKSFDVRDFAAASSVHCCHTFLHAAQLCLVRVQIQSTDVVQGSALEDRNEKTRRTNFFLASRAIRRESRPPLALSPFTENARRPPPRRGVSSRLTRDPVPAHAQRLVALPCAIRGTGTASSSTLPWREGSENAEAFRQGGATAPGEAIGIVGHSGRREHLHQRRRSPSLRSPARGRRRWPVRGRLSPETPRPALLLQGTHLAFLPSPSPWEVGSQGRARRPSG